MEGAQEGTDPFSEFYTLFRLRFKHGFNDLVLRLKPHLDRGIDDTYEGQRVARVVLDSGYEVKTHEETHTHTCIKYGNYCSKK